MMIVIFMFVFFLILIVVGKIMGKFVEDVVKKEVIIGVVEFGKLFFICEFYVILV